jgi:hypothetical protein
MELSDFLDLVRLGSERVASSPPREAEYWRGYVQGVKCRYYGELPHICYERTHLLALSENDHEDQYLVAYAKGYRDGFAGREIDTFS